MEDKAISLTTFMFNCYMDCYFIWDYLLSRRRYNHKNMNNLEGFRILRLAFELWLKKSVKVLTVSVLVVSILSSLMSLKKEK